MSPRRESGEGYGAASWRFDSSLCELLDCQPNSAAPDCRNDGGLSAPLVDCCAGAVRVLLIIDGSTLTSEESARKTQFETWGFTVSTLEDSSAQASYDAAFALNDVVYITEEVAASSVTTKARLTTLGVVNEEIQLNDDLGIATVGGSESSNANINVTNNSHSITSGFSTGAQAFLSSSQPRAVVDGTYASGLTVLGTNSSSVAIFGVIEQGATLANTISSNSTAAGRRVRLPIGGDSFAWSALNSTGLTLVRHSIMWAAGQEMRVHFKLDEGTGATTANATGLTSNGALTNGPTWSTGRRYNAVTFDGTNDYINVPYSASKSVTGLMTLAGWIKTQTVSGGLKCVMSTDTTGNGLSNYWLGIENGNLVFGFWASSAFRTVKTTTSPVSIGEWYHVAATFNDSTNTVLLYVNGALVQTGSLTYSPTTETADLLIGRSIDNEYWNGSLDDLRIYPKVLTLAEVAELYGLVGHWKLDETSGATAADSSGVGNPGAVTGTATWGSAVRANGFTANYTNGQDYIEIANSSSLQNVQEDSYSLAAWFKPTTLPPGVDGDNTGSYAILAKSGWHLGLTYHNTGTLFLEHWTGTTPSWNGAGAYFYNAPGKWYHLVGVVDRDAGTIKFYLNGVLVNTSTFTAGSATYEYGTEPFRIGVANPYNGTWGHAANGVIDDVRIYNRAIDAEEIAKVYGLVGRWKLDETSGTTAADSSGLGNSGTLTNGPTWTTSGVYDGGLTFDGTDDKVVVNNKQHFQLYEDFSCAGWVKLTNTTTAWRSVVGKGSNYYLETYGDQVYFGYYDGSAWKEVSTSSGTLKAGKWYHVAGSFDNTANTLKIYVDGALKSSAAATTTPASSSDKLQIGAAYDSASQFFPGTLDDVRVYNRALTASEPAEMYGMMGHWKLDETSGTTAADSSGLANMGTHVNGPVVGQSGVYDYAASTDGTDDYVAVKGDGTLTMSNAVTMAAWVKPTASSNSVRIIVNKEGEYEMALTPSGEVWWGFTNTTPGWSWHATGATVANSVWSHIVVTYNAGSVKTYVNGVLKETYSGAGLLGDTYTSLNELRIAGRSNSPTSQYYGGLVDDVRVYNRAISTQEVAYLYGLLGWYKFDELSGTTATDSSGNGNDGTYTGSPTLGASANGATSQGTAVEFNGSNYVEIPGLFDKSSSISATAWVRFSGSDSGGSELFSVGNCFSLRMLSGTPGAVAYYFNGASWIGMNLPQFTLNSGWRHLAMVLRGGDTLKIYVDGIEAASQSAPQTISYTGAGANTFVGKHGNAGTTYDLTGTVDDVRIFNRAVTPEEVFNIFYGSKVNGVKILKWVEVR